MLKEAILHPPCPWRAETRPFPDCVLGSEKSSRYPGERAGHGRLWEGLVRYRYACGFFSPAALPGKERVLARLGRAGVIVDLFEHPAAVY